MALSGGMMGAGGISAVGSHATFGSSQASFGSSLAGFRSFSFGNGAGNGHGPGLVCASPGGAQKVAAAGVSGGGQVLSTAAARPALRLPLQTWRWGPKK